MNVIVNRAREAFEQGNLADALRLASQALSQNPNDLDAMLLLGVLAVREKRWQDGLPLLQQATERDPDSAVAPYWLSMLYRRIGKRVAALEMASLAVERAPEDAQNHNQIGLCHLDFEQWTDAETCFRKAIRLAPSVPGAYENLGRTLQSQGRTAEAIKEFTRSLTIQPRQISVLCHLAQAALLELDYKTALDCANSVLRVDDNSVSGNLLAAKAWLGIFYRDEAAYHLSHALEASGDNPEALTQGAVLYQALGDREESERLLLRSIEIQPCQGFAYFAIVRDRRGRMDDGLVGQMETLLADPALPNRHRGDLHYALGMVREAQGDFETAMAHFSDANRIVRCQKFGENLFDASAFGAQTDRTIAEFEGLSRDRGCEDESPIFVVGAMRSGTTLVEQILACHPDIWAAGERRFWLANRDTSNLAESAERYLSEYRRIANRYKRIVDKMPGNYALLGLLHRALPNAKIIHVRRNPIDTCLSIWSTPNGARIEWAHDRSNIVFAYQEYLRMMNYWRSVLPPDRLMEIQYEDLVADPSSEIRNMIEFLGLPWSEECLHPERNLRPVNTPSVMQVRRPVNDSSVGRWRRFEPWLGEFAQLKHGQDS